MAPSLLSSISAVILATTVAAAPTEAASTNSSAARATFGTITSKPGECVVGDPNTYLSKADLQWIWDNRMQEVKTYDNWIMDHLVKNKGSINYCIRWDSDKKLTKEIAAKLQPMLTRQHAAWNHWLIGYNCWPYDEIKVNVVGVILDKFNLTEVEFEHEQRRPVRYLADALAPPSFKAVISTKLTLQANKKYKNEVVPFCTWVTKLMREFTTWEHAAQAATPSQPQQQQSGSGHGGRGSGGGRGQHSSRGGSGGGRGRRNGGGRGDRGEPAVLSAESQTATPTPTPSREDSRPVCGAYLKCGSRDHQARDCPSCQPGEATQLLQELRAHRDAARSAAVPRFDVVAGGNEEGVDEGSASDRGTVDATVDGVTMTALLLDSGADTSLVARGVLEDFARDAKPLTVSPVDGVSLLRVGKREVAVTRMVTFGEDLLATSAGPLMLRNLVCYVEEDNVSMEVTVSRPIMKILGYSTDKFLVEARKVSPEWELGGHHAENNVGPTALQRVCRLQMATREPSLTPEETEAVDRRETRPALPRMRPTNLTEVIKYLENKVEIATRMGLTLDGRVKLRAVVHVRVYCFRLEFGNDPPVRVAPMQVRLKPGATPVKAQPRRYSPSDREFLDRHTATLLQHGLIFKNHRSRWASAPRIVLKKEQDVDPNADPRMVIDTRSVNERMETMPWPMPVLEVVLGELEGAKVFFVLDWFRGYWQLPLHPDSQAFYSFVTHRDIYTPTRVPMGATDAVAYCQGVVEEVFGDLLGRGILAWLDDILGYAESEEALLVLLEKVLERCQKYGLKLHAKKCEFFTRG